MLGPCVTVVVNNYNYGRFLGTSIESALAQTYERKQVVVVDDASTDDSQAIIRGYGSAVDAVLKARNAGQGAAFNTGFAASRGDLVIFLDADDFLYPGAVSRIVEVWRPGLAVIQYRLHLVDEGGSVFDLHPPPEIRFDRGDVRRKLLTTGRFEGTVTTGMAFSRNVLAAVLPVPEDEFRIAADGYLVSVAPLYGEVAAIDEPLGAYRRHGNNRFGWGSDPGVHLQRVLRHEFLRYEILVRRATTLGLSPDPRPGDHDYAHLIARMASLCLDAVGHPVASDSRIGLAMLGLTACRHASLRYRHKALLSIWFLATGLLPRRLSRLVVQWPFVPSSRPQWVSRALKSIRSVLR